MPLRGAFTGCLPCGGVLARVRDMPKRSVRNKEDADAGRPPSAALLDLQENENTPRMVSRGTSVQSFLDFCRAEGPATSSQAVSAQSLLAWDGDSQQKHEASAKDTMQMTSSFTAPDDGHNTGMLMSSPLISSSDPQSCEQVNLDSPKVVGTDTGRPHSIPTPPPGDDVHTASLGTCQVFQAALQQQRRQESEACLPTQAVPLPPSQCFRENSSETLPPSEHPTLLTSKHFEKQVLKAPKLYDHREPESTAILGMPPVIPSNVPSRQMLGTARSAAPTTYELPAPVASQRTLVNTQTMGMSLDPFLHAAPATPSTGNPLDPAMETAPDPRGLTSKTYDIACLASKLAGRWAYEAGGVLAASTKEASVSAAGMIADASRKVDASVTSYVQQAWESIAERVNDEGDTESESSSDAEGSAARAPVRAHGHSNEHPAGYMNSAIPPAGVPQAIQMAVPHPRSASFSIPTAGYTGGFPRSLSAAGSYHAGSPAWQVAVPQQMPQAALAWQPLPHGNTFSISAMDPRWQVLPRSLTFSHAGVAAPHLHSPIRAAPLLQR